MAQYILSANEMQDCDNRTMTEHGIPSLVLMERAAMKVVEAIGEEYPEAYKFAVVCGPGNNGGDGVAVARMLHQKGCRVRCFTLGNSDKYTDQLKQEIAIAESYGLTIESTFDETAIAQANITIDAMFGIGLTRGLAGDYENAAVIINENANKVVAVDIPSGYDANCGKLLGNTGIKADLTVTFAYMKKGLLLADCKSAAGKIITADVGIYLDELKDKYDIIIDDTILSQIRPRPADANKGSCGKLLVIAGSENIYGACYLSAKAALSSGAGLVKIYTHKNNTESIRQNLPEAMFLGYNEYNEDELLAQLKWADTILIGPGLGTDEVSIDIFKKTIETVTKPIIIDADGINLAAASLPLLKQVAARTTVILTPHLKEMERLTGIKVADININQEQVAKDFALEYGLVVVLKNHTTIVTDGNRASYIVSGNQALATPGSGDVLAGLVASLIGQDALEKEKPLAETGECTIEKALLTASTAAYIHGKAGQKASTIYGIRGVLASHIIDNFEKI